MAGLVLSVVRVPIMAQSRMGYLVEMLSLVVEEVEVLDLTVL